ncbi:MAG: riboflavin synthase [Deltaproteobacteria bacterium]|nr:riboflavin synthase [Deltaproteobacteria bacterium]
MFTGIIEGTGRIKSVKKVPQGMQIEIAADFDLERSNVGESIAVNGCCLTITSRLGTSFWADVSAETLDKTTLGDLQEGSAVNLERPLKMGERLGGHLVQGHVDGIGSVEAIQAAGEAREIRIQSPQKLACYLVEKGSIAVDGVSLTINQVERETFSVMIIPHTQMQTTFHGLKTGSRVNLEVDIIGKYVAKLTHLDSEEYQKGTKITQEFLKKHGF